MYLCPSLSHKCARRCAQTIPGFPGGRSLHRVEMGPGSGVCSVWARVIICPPSHLRFTSRAHGRGWNWLSFLTSHLVVCSAVARSRVQSACRGLRGHRGPHTSRSRSCRDTAAAGSGPAHRTGGCASGCRDRRAEPGPGAAAVRRVSALRRGLPRSG